MKAIVVLNSATTAKRVEKTIARYGVISNVFKAPKMLAKSGCSHCVSFDDKYINIVFEIINKSEINKFKIYREIFAKGKIYYDEILQ